MWPSLISSSRKLSLPRVVAMASLLTMQVAVLNDSASVLLCIMNHAQCMIWTAVRGGLVDSC